MLTIRKLAFFFSSFFCVSVPLVAMEEVISKIRAKAEINEIKKAINACRKPSSSAVTVLGILGSDENLSPHVVDLLVRTANTNDLKEGFPSIPHNVNAYARKKIKARLKSQKKSDHQTEAGIEGIAEDKSTLDQQNKETNEPDTVRINLNDGRRKPILKKRVSIFSYIKWGGLCALLGYAGHCLYTSKVTKRASR